MKWQASIYDEKLNFIYKYGEDVVELLAPQPDEKILDLGCGTGELTSLIASTSTVVGVDASSDMVNLARQKFPDIDFRLCKAEDLCFDHEFDAVFSNAALHWIAEQNQSLVIKHIYNSLKNGGRLVAEFGGYKNVDSLVNAIKTVLSREGFEANSKISVWYFPKLSEYCTLLEKQGFLVSYAIYFDRDTKLGDEQGIRKWLEMFSQGALVGIADSDKERLIDLFIQQLADTNKRDDFWYADYRRLRLKAIKRI